MIAIPTVRVVNPANPAEWIIMNAADVGPQHALWDGESLPPVAAAGEAGADVVTRFMHKMMAAKRGGPLSDWLALPAAERMAAIIEAEREFDDMRATHERDMAELRSTFRDEPDAGTGEGVQMPTVDAETGEVIPGALRVIRGGRGKWFVKRGAENVAGGFDTEAEAQRALAAEMNAGGDE